ncbi:unnamed protein product [Pylaiella littoralis]
MATPFRWICKQCEEENPNDEDFCDKCFAPRSTSGAPRKTCRTCLHRHSTGNHCHVFVISNKRLKRKTVNWNKPRRPTEGEGTDEEDSSSGGSSDYSSGQDAGRSGEAGGEDEEEDEEEEEEEEEDSSEDSSESSGHEDDDGEDEPKKPKKGLLGLGDRLAAKAAAIAKTAGSAIQAIKGGGRLRETPPWAKAACFRRCNCNHGVPKDSTAFVPLQEGRTLQHALVGMVTVRMEPLEGAELEFENRPPLARTPPSPYALRLFLEYMDSRTVAACARTSSEWHRECYERDEEGLPMHPTYVGIHFMELESSLEACQDKIDGIFFHQPPTGSAGQLFTSGQRKVTVWRREETEVAPEPDESTPSEGSGSQRSGESSAQKNTAPSTIEVSWQTAGVCVRDTAPFTMINPVNSSIICCSSNGSIREWSLAHEVKNTRFLAQMWEHNGLITGVAFTAPSVGFCKAHSAPQHSCYMYSVSDDRCLKVWDLATKECMHTVKPKLSDCGTLQSVTKSDYHLYVGSSNGRIVVYSLGRVCLRPERHRCHLHDEPRWFCEQETLELGREPVQYMVCGGVGGKYKYLFTGARDGTIQQVWNVPKASFGHTKVCAFREHKRAITALSLTKVHLFSASDEGHVRVWSLGTLCLQRVVRQEWRIKCIWVHHAPPDSPDPGKGSLFLGLATGVVLAYPITDAV